MKQKLLKMEIMKTKTFLLATTLAFTAITGTISAQQALNLAVSTMQPTCYASSDGAYVINISGGTSPYTVNGVPLLGSTYVTTDLQAGNYVVTVEDANFGSSTADITLIQPAPINVSAIVNHATSYGGANGSIDLTTSVPCTYSWSAANGSPVEVYAEDQVNLRKDIYRVIVTEISTGCTANARYDVTQPAAPSLNSGYTPKKNKPIGSTSSNKSVTVYPNPSAGSINIKADGETVEAYIINEMGAMIYQVNLDLESGIQSLELERGVYTMFYTEADGSTYAERIIIK